MSTSLKGLVQASGLPRAARTAADWVDLQYWQLIRDMTDTAPRTKGRLLDVGCGEKPYEYIYTPYVTEYVGVEYEETFGGTQTSARSKKPDFFSRTERGSPSKTGASTPSSASRCSSTPPTRSRC